MARSRDQIRLFVNRLRLRIAECLLPPRFYVQERPFNCFYGKEFPGFADEILQLNKRPDKLSRDGNRWYMLNLLLLQVRHCDAGDYAELGTYRGRSARIIYQQLVPETLLFCFDTFAGFIGQDVEAESEYSAVIPKVGTYTESDIQKVQRYVAAGQDDRRVVIRPGRFPSTFGGLEGRKWRFVHLDCDLAEPTKAGLRCFWPGLVPGGVIVVHDYNGYWAEGIQRVIWEFSRQTGVPPVPVADGAGSAVLIKPL